MATNRHRSLVGRSGRRFFVRYKDLAHIHTHAQNGGKITSHVDLNSKKIRANRTTRLLLME